MANEARFEVYPQTRRRTTGEQLNGVDSPIPTGEFGWRFRSANGQIEATGGEGFTRRADAHRAVKDFVAASGKLVERFGDHDEPIIDVDG